MIITHFDGVRQEWNDLTEIPDGRKAHAICPSCERSLPVYPYCEEDQWVGRLCKECAAQRADQSMGLGEQAQTGKAKIDPVIDPIRDLLCSLNANLAEMGIDERLIFACDVPVTIAWNSGKYESTVRVHFTDTGLHIPESEAQARRLVDEVKDFEKQTSE